MRVLPKSLYGRLLLSSVVATLAALVFAALAIGAVLERFVMQGLDERLDAQIAILATAVQPDGTVDRARIALAAPYDRATSGWGWRIDAPGGTITSPAPLEIAMGRAPEPPRPPHRDHGRRGGPGDEPPFDHDARPLEWRAQDGSPRHGRALTIATPAGPVRIAASAPRAIVQRPIRAAMAPLLGSLLLLGLALGAATLIQLRIGLRPLRRLRDAIGAVRSGRATQVPDDQPSELRPLAQELNALLADNEAALANARGHVANLAHGLKTPLATLALALRDAAHDPDGNLGREVARIDHAIRHHLGRARAGTPDGVARARTRLAPALDGLIDALARIHAERGIAVDRVAAPDLTLAIDAQDLDELLGNLLDNAWRWAARRITIAVSDDAAGKARVAIADDGPGIPESARSAAMKPGRRLDESGDGHGFGLSIARELAELYGGALTLDAAPGGGLVATVALPRAGDVAPT